MKHTSPKEIFLQLFSTAMLYISIIGTFVATFSLTNWFIQSDNINSNYPRTIEDLGNMLSFPLAMLVVAFPLFMWSSYIFYKRVKKNQDLQASKSHVWLTNLTLFLAALIITITAITVVYSFFDGELTMRTVIKSAIVMLVSILTIVWYRAGEEKGEVVLTQKVAATIGIVLFLITIIVGIITMGSPKERRMIKEDRQIRYALQDTYYSLEAPLNEGSSASSTFPAEFKTPDAIEYNKIDDSTAELCAVFATAHSEDDEMMRPTRSYLDKEDRAYITMPEWSHTPGKNCFELKIRK